MSANADARTGACLCGAVTFTADRLSDALLQCHCENCRRLSGNFVAATRTSSAKLQIGDPNGHFHWFDLEYAKYGFCSACGSTLFYQAADRPEITAVMVGSLDDASDLSVESVWFSDEALPHNTLPESVPHHKGNG